MTTTSDIATRDEGPVAAGSGGALAVYAGQTEWTPEQEAALVQLGLAEASDADRKVFLHVAQRVGLDPFARQIYMIGRWDSDLGAKKWTIQTGIDGFRAKAEEHPQYAGQLPIQWCGEDGQWVDIWLDRKKKPTAARARILRHDREQPVIATCLFEEFAQYKKGGGLNSMWDGKGVHMIGKCAEAGGLRAAFPQTFSGLVTDDEAHGLDRQARTTRVASERAPAAPVEVTELTGKPAPAAAPASTPRAAPSTAPRPAAPLAGGTGRASSAHTKRLFAAARRDESPDDTMDWASAVLGRALRSWGSISADEANDLIARLEAGPPPGGWEAAEVVVQPAQGAVVDAEVVDPPTAASPAADDDHADEYAQLEAERDAARGDA